MSIKIQTIEIFKNFENFQKYLEFFLDFLDSGVFFHRFLMKKKFMRILVQDIDNNNPKEINILTIVSLINQIDT